MIERSDRDDLDQGLDCKVYTQVQNYIADGWDKVVLARATHVFNIFFKIGQMAFL